MNNYIIQAIGFLGLILVMISFQKNKRSFTLTSQFFAALMFTAHYFLLGAWTGSGMNLISAGRQYVFSFREKKKWAGKRVILYLFIFLFWVMGVITWHGKISLLPVIAMTIDTVAIWCKSPKHLRWIFISARPFWIVYNIIVGSYAGLITEIIISISIIVAIVRFDLFNSKRAKKHNKNNPNQ